MSKPGMEAGVVDRTGPTPSRVRRTIEEALQSGEIVGTTMIAHHRGRPVVSLAAGYADREKGLPASLDTVYRWASLTKLAVTVAALSLVEAGRLRLDSAVDEFVPLKPALADGRRPTITIAHLLSHTSGLSYGFNDPEGGEYATLGISDGIDRSTVPMADTIERLDRATLLFEPGTSWTYSLSTDVLGHILEVIEGRRLADIVEERVLRPLGLRDSGFTLEPSDRIAKPYCSTEDGGARPMTAEDRQAVPGAGFVTYGPDRLFDPECPDSGGAGMAGTAGDYIEILECLRKGGAPLLSSQSVDLIAHAAPPTADGSVGPMPGLGFSHGAAVVVDPETVGTVRSKGSWGWGGVYGAAWFIDPAVDLSVVSLTNTAMAGMSGFPFQVRLEEALYADLAES